MRHITLIIAALALVLAAPAIADKGGNPNGGNGKGKDEPQALVPSSPVETTQATGGPGKYSSGKPLGSISVTDDGLSSISDSVGMTSHFTASGCGFRANDDSYYMVVRGPGLYTDGLTYWVDHFPVGSDGCGSASPSWSGSGVVGTFDVYIVRSASNNPWQAQPASNVVTVHISSP